MKKRYLLKKGKYEDFLKYQMKPGEMCAITDKNTLAFCFNENEVEFLKFDENVTTEKVEMLISKISKFIENQ